MQRVAQSEYDILTVARALVGEGSYATIEPTLVGKREFPPQLGPTSMRLLEATLSRGVVLELARRGGWRPSQQLTPSGTVANGRMWDRHAAAPAPALAFSAFSMELCRWLASGQAGSVRGAALSAPRGASLTLGDELLLYMALDLLRGSGIEGNLAEQAPVRSSGLAWLGFPDILVRRLKASETIRLPGFAPYCASAGAVVLEALQQDLARRWLEMERAKKDIRALDTMSRLGAAQTAVLDALMAAADKAGRRDLATFLLDAGVKLFPRALPPSAWIESLEGAGSMSERTAARRAAGSFLRALVKWREWDGQHRGVRFIDDGYDVAQLLLSRYELFGASGLGYAEAVLRAMDTLEAAAAVAAGESGGASAS